jgi:hypothetical protein
MMMTGAYRVETPVEFKATAQDTTQNAERVLLAENIMPRPTPCTVSSPQMPPPNATHLFDVHVGISRTRARSSDISRQQQCCEVCTGLLGCSHWLIRRAPSGSVGTCALYGRRDSSPSESDSTEPPFVLLRSAAQKLLWLTRCHAERIRWLRSAIGEEGRLEMLVDATSLPSVDDVPHARTQLRTLLGIPAYLYNVEMLREAFPAVRHWPSPQSHAASLRRQRGGEQVMVWWRSVLDANREAMGSDVANRLVSYLIHEPSLVLWARDKGSGLGRGGHVWVVEDDAVFLGDLRGFLHSYRLRAADYVATFANLDGTFEVGSHRWKVNDAFVDLFANRRVHKWEHVERFSMALIERLGAILVSHGAVAHGEMYASTVCFAEPWCVSDDLRLTGVVAPDAHLYGASALVLSLAQPHALERIHARHRAAGAPGVWLHAVKNYCNALDLESNHSIRISTDAPGERFSIGYLGPERLAAKMMVGADEKARADAAAIQSLASSGCAEAHVAPEDDQGEGDGCADVARDAHRGVNSSSSAAATATATESKARVVEPSEVAELVLALDDADADDLAAHCSP